MQREGRAARYSLASVLLVLSGCNGGAATNGLSRTGFQPAFLAPAQPGLRWEGPGAMKCWRSAPAVASPRTRSVTRGLVMGADGGEDFLRSFASFLGLPSSAEDRRKAQVQHVPRTVAAKTRCTTFRWGGQKSCHIFSASCLQNRFSFPPRDTSRSHIIFFLFIQNKLSLAPSFSLALSFEDEASPMRQVEMKRRREGARRGPPVEKKPAPPPRSASRREPDQDMPPLVNFTWDKP